MAYRSSFGSITKLSDGRWRLRYWAQGPDGYKRRSKVVRGTKKEASAELARLQLRHGKDAPEPTMNQCHDVFWRPSVEAAIDAGRLRESTVKGYESIWRCHVGPRWGDREVASIGHMEVQEWLNSVSRSQRRNALGVAAQVAEAAVLNDAVAKHPFRARYMLPEEQPSAEYTIAWDLEELERLYRTVKGHWLEPAFLLMAFGSCRVGEAWAVESKDVRLVKVDGVDVCMAHIDKQVDPDGELVGELKTRTSRRAVVLPDTVGRRLAELAKEADEDEAKDGRLMGFCDGYLARKYLTAEWHRICRRADVKMGAFSRLRASWATFTRWDLKVDDIYLERMMGHVGGSKVTSTHYDRAAAEQFAQVLAEAYAQNPYCADWDDVPC